MLHLTVDDPALQRRMIPSWGCGQGQYDLSYHATVMIYMMLSLLR